MGEIVYDTEYLDCYGLYGWRRKREHFLSFLGFWIGFELGFGGVEDDLECYGWCCRHEIELRTTALGSGR